MGEALRRDGVGQGRASRAHAAFGMAAPDRGRFGMPNAAGRCPSRLDAAACARRRRQEASEIFLRLMRLPLRCWERAHARTAVPKRHRLDVSSGPASGAPTAVQAASCIPSPYRALTRTCQRPAFCGFRPIDVLRIAIFFSALYPCIRFFGPVPFGLSDPIEPMPSGAANAFGTLRAHPPILPPPLYCLPVINLLSVVLPLVGELAD